MVVINIDETDVKLVPQERAGHVSRGAYRLFVQGRPMGRNASLSAQRSTITHAAAMCDRADFQTLLPQVVLVGANQVGEERLARICMTAPACVRIWRLPKAWMSNAVRVRYMRLLGSARHSSCPTAACRWAGGCQRRDGRQVAFWSRTHRSRACRPTLPPRSGRSRQRLAERD